MKFGISEQDMSYILDQIRRFPEIEEAILFGSRAKGNYKQGSDIDIAILGSQITFDTVANLHASLQEEGPLPYYFDIVDANNLQETALKEHVQRVGKQIYKR